MATESERQRKTSTPFRNRIVGHASADPRALIPNTKNWRLHPKAQREALRDLVDTLGWIQAVIVNRSTGRLVDGHLRVELAILRHEQEIPVEYVELTEAEEALALATFDPIGALASADRAVLDELLRNVEQDGALGDLLSQVARAAGLPARGTAIGLSDPDDAPEPPAVSDRVTPGQIWRLGTHRLICGDSTDAAVIRAVLGGAHPRLLWTDPSYGVDYRPGGRQGLQNDDLPRDEYRDWLASALAALNLPAGAGAYLCHADTLGDVVREVLRAAGFHLSACLVWTKPSLVMGRGDYHWQHEPIWYGWREGAAHSWFGDRRQSTVWSLAGDRVARGAPEAVHPTRKPVALIERALFNSSAPGDVVIDPFLGSGSTLIAAERTGRLLRAVEIEPRFVQAAIERWETFTGEQAELL